MRNLSMEIRDYAHNPAELPEGTLVQRFLDAAERFGARPAFRYHEGGEWKDVSFSAALERVGGAAAALRAVGLQRGDRAAILSPNRPEWAIADYACLCTGVVDVPIYASLTAAQIAYILNNSGARLIFVSDAEQLAKIQAVRTGLKALEWVVVFDPPAKLPAGTLSWEGFLAEGSRDASATSEEAFRAEALQARPDDVATILYTSGTTGDPKGVMLTHNNVHSNVLAGLAAISVTDADSTLSFLPLSHVFQRTVDYLILGQGASIAYARSLDTVAEDLRAVRPTVVVSVPRLYEKVYARVTEAHGLRGALVGWARGVGGRWADAKLAGREPPRPTAIAYRIAHRLVFSKIYAGVGGRLRFFVSGGAPLSPDIARFFFSAGILILEGYGLTETSPVTNVNSDKDFPANFRIGTVGKPVAATEVRIASDGEILIRGPQVMKGYFGSPEATREVIDPEGWFHTGDVGEIDADGFLRITDRKKDIIVTAGGKNVAPQPIENALKRNRFMDQAVLLGDRRRFISLLLVPDFTNLEGWAREKGIAAPRGELLAHSEVHALLEAELERELAEFSRVERPKKVLLLEQEFTIEDGSLTPTQKVKRKVVEDRYRQKIEEMYDEANEARTFFTN